MKVDKQPAQGKPEVIEIFETPIGGQGKQRRPAYGDDVVTHTSEGFVAGESREIPLVHLVIEHMQSVLQNNYRGEFEFRFHASRPASRETLRSGIERDAETQASTKGRRIKVK